MDIGKMDIDKVLKICGAVLGLAWMVCNIRKVWHEGSKSEAQRDLLKAQEQKMKRIIAVPAVS
jgi:hypothetical protein